MNKDKPYFKFYCDIIETQTWAKLSLAAKAIYPVIAKYTNIKTQQSFPSLKTIEKWAGLAREAVVKGIKELVNNGLIIKKSGGGRISNLYQLVDLYSSVIEPLQFGSRTSADKPTELQQTDKPNTNYINITNSNITISNEQIIIDKGKNIVDNFYTKLGLKATSIKREKGYTVAKRLFEEGYSEDEIRATITWAVDNLKDKIQSFSIIPHIIDQAIKDKQKAVNKRRFNIESENQVIKERKAIEAARQARAHASSIRDLIPKEELSAIEEEARIILKQDESLKNLSIPDFLVKIKTDALILKKYPLK